MINFNKDSAVDIDPNGRDGSYLRWENLSPFCQGYVEAMLSGVRVHGVGEYASSRSARFSDLAPETLARIMEDCAKGVELSIAPLGRQYNDNASGGACLYEDRQSGRLTGISFPPLTVYLGDEGKIYFRS